jgi:rhodanese-related sulfurtransferase
MSVATIGPSELQKLLSSGQNIELIDVRTPVEFRTVHLAHAKNVPLDQLDPQSIIKSHSNGSRQPIYLICQAGTRGRNACEKLIQAGYPEVVNVEGGTQACIASGLPVVRGKQSMSLERQVRIAAGSLVLLGVILGALVHPAFFGLSGFVGAGLVFAGVTDTCGMGMLLARMPWNQDRGAACSTT